MSDLDVELPMTCLEAPIGQYLCSKVPKLDGPFDVCVQDVCNVPCVQTVVDLLQHLAMTKYHKTHSYWSKVCRCFYEI